MISSIAGVDILVADEDYENAVQVLRHNQSWPEELTLCPYCGSSDIKFVLRKGHKLRAVGAAVLSMLAAAPPGDNHWEYTCSSVIRLLRHLSPNFNLREKTKNVGTKHIINTMKRKNFY